MDQSIDWASNQDLGLVQFATVRTTKSRAALLLIKREFAQCLFEFSECNDLLSLLDRCQKNSKAVNNNEPSRGNKQQATVYSSGGHMTKTTKMSKLQQSGTVEKADEDVKKLRSQQKTKKGSKMIPELVPQFKKVPSWHVGLGPSSMLTLSRRMNQSTGRNTK
jgi:hypothetical protein